MAFFKVVIEPYIIGVGENEKTEGGISEAEYTELSELFQNKPTAPDGFKYLLRADNLEWDLVASGGGL